MKQNYAIMLLSFGKEHACTLFLKKSKSNFKGLFLVLLTLISYSNNLFSQIAQRGAATTATSTNNNTITIAKPAGVVAGDIMIANITSIDDNSLSGNNASLAGWTIISASNINGNNARRCSILYKIAGVAEPTNYTFNASNGTITTDNTSGAIIAYSGVDNTTPFDVAPGGMDTGSASTVTATAITTVTANAAVIFLSALRRDDRSFDTWTTGAPSNLTLTETYDYSPNNYPGIGSAWSIQGTPGNSGIGSCVLNNNSPYVGILIALRPTPPTPPTITTLGAASGCVGSSLIINGTNLLTATAVTIGGTAATITGTTATSVTVTVGTGTTGTVQVTTPAGTATSGSTFTVNPLPTITLTSAAGTNNQTRCINTAITNITYTVAGGGATGATVTGLPTGVSGNYAGGTVTITGTPSVSGTFNYTITTTGGSCSTTATGTITVRALPTIVLSSAATTANQSICRGSAITNIVYTIGGGATGVNPTGLPAGLTANLVGSTYTISGTPTANGTFNYTLTTSGGAPCANATINGTIVVNALPAAIAGGATTVCVGGTTPAFTNATGGGTWSTSNANATIDASGILTGVTAGNVGVIYTLPTGCFVQTALITINSLPSTVATPTPTNGATGVCYAGSGAVTSISWGVVAGATSYDVYFGAGSVPATVTANVTTNTYNIGTLTANTTYYWRIVAKNACGDAPTSATFSFTTNVIPCYCASSGGTYPNGITGVNFNTINNLNTAVNVAYSDYTYISTSIVKTLTYNLRVFVNTGGFYTDYQSAYIDWNGDGDFVDAGEFYNLGSATNVTNGLTSLSPLPITVPAGAITGPVRMRIQSKYFSATSGSCQTGFDGEVEDYMLNIVAATPCVAPTAQPTALNLTATGSIISGSFTASAPASDSYLVIIGTSATPPAAPVNGTNYTVGNVYQAGGYSIVDIDNNTIFAATGLSASTTYYFYIYSYNNLCTGGPLYLGTSPLTGNATTTALTYCEPSTTLATEYITGVASVGTINDVSNTSGYTPGGYANYSSIIIATQIPSGGVNLNINFNPLPGEAQFIKTWVDWNNNNIFEDPTELVYTTGNTATGPTSFGFIIPGAQPSGNYRMRIKTRNYGGTSSGNSTYDPCSSHDRGETEDYTIRVIADCTSKITSVTNGSACGPTNTVSLSATMSAGSTQIRWYSSLTGGTPIGTGSPWTTPAISTTTTYYVSAWNGSCETLHRTPVIATILPTTNITVTPSVPEVCGEGNVVEITAAGDFVKETILTQDFESGMAPFTVATPLNTNAGADTPWSVKTSPYQPTTTSVWRPAVNSGAIGSTGNRFAFTTSDYNNSNIQTIMTSPVIDASLYNSLTLTFDHYYSYFGGDSGVIEVATNPAGNNWATAGAIVTFNSDLGSASKFITATVDLSAFAGISTLRFRFVYNGSWDDGWAVDNIKLEGIKPLNTTFTWTGGTVEAFTDAACTTLYTNQAVTTVYVRPTPLQLASPSWSFTANATLGNGCPISQLITINNKTKLWKGTVDNNWYNSNNWEPIGVPDANNCVFIYPGSPAANTSNINTTANDGFAKSITVRPSGVLTIHPNNDLTVTDAVTVDAGGTFNIENTGSLIQINNVANSGTISMKRNASLRALDYVYWSSPVVNFASSAISPLTPTGLIWKWEPTTSTAYVPQFGNWVNGNETMTIGRGYIVRSPNGWPSTNSTLTANFIGVPNNGTITRTITRSTYTGGPTTGPTSTPITANDDNWNLIGNPYPSSIDAISFLSTNATHINNFLDLWTHGNTPATMADPFYQDYQLNYNPNDYLRYNSLGGTQYGFEGKIGAGQGFFVLMRDTGSTTENVVFNNNMRGNTNRNDQFFRTSNSTSQVNEIERHRIWLKMIAPNLVSSDNLVGYATDATNNLDDKFDAINRGIKVNFELYSLSENQGLSIQGRSLPFDQNDQIPLGVAISQNGIHTIVINAVDGLFTESTQNIYLQDLVLGITHNLRLAPYTFTATPGRYENRFVLKFNNETLSNEDFSLNQVTVYSNDNIHVSAPNQVIKSVRIHDLLGKVLGSFNNVNSDSFVSRNISKMQSPILVEVTLDNGKSKTYKVIF